MNRYQIILWNNGYDKVQDHVQGKKDELLQPVGYFPQGVYKVLVYSEWVNNEKKISLETSPKNSTCKGCGSIIPLKTTRYRVLIFGGGQFYGVKKAYSFTHYFHFNCLPSKDLAYITQHPPKKKRIGNGQI